jgi:protein-tyrosine phosphatase
MSFDDDVTEVLPGQLYQGSLLSLEPATLQRLGITHIVNAAANELKPRVYTHASIAHCNLKLEDSEGAHLFNMPVNLIDAYRFIDKALAEGGRVLVHCAQGKSRSSSVTLFYLIKSRQQHVDVALAELQALRPIVKPNASFLTQLRDYCTSEEIPNTNKRTD